MRCYEITLGAAESHWKNQPVARFMASSDDHARSIALALGKLHGSDVRLRRKGEGDTVTSHSVMPRGTADLGLILVLDSEMVR